MLSICRFIVVACAVALGACSERKQPPEVIHASQSKEVTGHSAWDQLDLNLLKRTVMRAPDAHTLEGWLNWPEQYEQIPLHNADFDDDGVLDVISVREVHTRGARGFSFNAHMATTPEPLYIATIEIEHKPGSSFTHIYTYGGDYLYDGYYDHDIVRVRPPIVVWLWSPHTTYSARYGYGRMPSGYSPRSRVTVEVHRSYTSQIRSRATTLQYEKPGTDTPRRKRSYQSPNRGKVPKEVSGNKSLISGTRSKKSFERRDPNKARVAKDKTTLGSGKATGVAKPHQVKSPTKPKPKPKPKSMGTAKKKSSSKSGKRTNK